MKQLKLTACAAGMLLLFAVIVHIAGPNASAMQAGNPPVINNPDLIFPTVKIIRLGETVVRLDTTSGELSRFIGTISGTGATGRWIRMARPLTANTSGLLDVKRIGGGTFLIDLETGKTWLLRRSGTTLGTWVLVQKS